MQSTRANLARGEFEDSERSGHVLDVYLVNGRPVDLRLDGDSLFPVWFKLEFKEDGQVSAKVKGVRLATRFGDEINIHQLPQPLGETLR